MKLKAEEEARTDSRMRRRRLGQAEARTLFEFSRDAEEVQALHELR